MANQTGQTVDGVIDGLLQICTTVFTDPFNGQQLLVCEGAPGSYQPDLIVAVATAVRQPVTRPTMGTQRSRERQTEIDIAVSCFVGGDGSDGSQRSARLQCNALTDTFEDYFRTKPNETLNNACRESFVSNIDGPTLTTVYHPQTGAVTGRAAESVITVTAYIRY